MSEWQPIETAPRVVGGAYILGWSELDGILVYRWVAFARSSPECGYWDAIYDTEAQADPPTHWMPLPPPPAST